MLLGCVIVHCGIFDNNGIDAVAGGFCRLEGMKERRVAVDRLEVRMVFFSDGHGVECVVSAGTASFKVEHVGLCLIADGQNKLLCARLPVDEHRVAAFVPDGGNGECVVELGEVARQGVVGIDPAVERTVDG